MLFRVTVLPALVALVTIVTTAVTQSCSPGPVDVMFVLSPGASQDQADYDQLLDLVKGFVNSVNIGNSSNDVRLGLLTEYNYADLEFTMADHLSKAELELAIQFTYLQTTVGDPDFGSGLQYVREFGMDTHLGGRPGVPDVVIFLTNGVPSNTSLAEEEATKLTNSNVTVIVLGTGNSNMELQTLASGCHYASLIPDFSSVADITSTAVNFTCDAINRLPADTDCESDECSVEADVVLLLDATVAQGRDNFQGQLDFAQALVNQLNIGPNGTRVAAVTYSYDGHPRFDLDDYTNKTELLQALSAISNQGGLPWLVSRHPEEGLAYISLHGFDAARPEAHKIVVLTSTGPVDAPTMAVTEASGLKSRGVTILSLGIGAAVPQEVASMASGGQYVKYFADFTELIAGANDTASLICEMKGMMNLNLPIVPVG